MPVTLQNGVLLKADESTIIFLLHWNEQSRGAAKFVLQQLDSKSLFIKPEKTRVVQAILRHRLQETVFDEENEESKAAGAAGGK
jgi:hypothetical protein